MENDKIINNKSKELNNIVSVSDQGTNIENVNELIDQEKNEAAPLVITCY